MVTHGRRFTLVELLVVIAIVAVLAGLLLPALAGAREQARRTKAKVQMKALQTAIAMYESDYGVLPVSPPSSYATGTWPPDSWVTNVGASSMTGNSTKYDDLIDILQGDNPRGKTYLEIVTEQGKGAYRDPWRKEYWVALDGDYDGDIDCEADAGSLPTWPTGPVYGKTIYEKAAVWAWGKDQANDWGGGSDSDDVISWGN